MMIKSKCNILAIVLSLPLLALYVNAQVVTFDITNYGATPMADISQALTKAWKAAILSKMPSKIVIPTGIWTLSQVKLEGPNFAPLNLENRGSVVANPDPNSLPDQKGEWIMINYVNFFTLSGGGVFDGKGQQAWKINDCATNDNCPKLPINLSFNFINNSVIHDVTTKDSKSAHMNCISSSNVTFTSVTISAPGDSPNTDGLHVARSTSITVADSVIATGDDCISMGDELTEVYIQNVTCGPGHGISVGSLGKNTAEKDVSGIHVTNCTFVNTENGVRVKTWPSAPATLRISDLHFEDLVMVNAGNPIIITQEYCPNVKCDRSKPSLIQISNMSIDNVRGSSSTREVVTFLCSSAKPCQDVRIGDVNIIYNGKEGGNTTCVNVQPTFSGKQIPRICA